jgi:hypothetical protein
MKESRSAISIRRSSDNPFPARVVLEEAAEAARKRRETVALICNYDSASKLE